MNERLKIILPQTGDEFKKQILGLLKKQSIDIYPENGYYFKMVPENIYPSVILFINYREAIPILKEIAEKNKKYGGFNINIVEKEQPNLNDEIYANTLFNTNLNMIIQKALGALLGESQKISSILGTSYDTTDFNEKNGKIIGFYSPKGGVGKTQITNITAETVNEFVREDVSKIIIDANFSEGSLSKRFEENTQAYEFDNIVAAFESGENFGAAIRAAIVKEPHFLYRYSKGYGLKNMDILFAPRSKDETVRKIFGSKEFHIKLFSELKKMYDVIFVDMSNEKTTPTNKFLMSFANEVNLIMTTDTYAAEQARDFLDQLDSSISINKFNLFLNDWNSIDTTLTPEEICAFIFNVSPGAAQEMFDNNRVYLIPSVRKIRKINNTKDGLFNPNNKYLTDDEKMQILIGMKKMYKKTIPHLLKGNAFNSSERVEKKASYEKQPGLNIDGMGANKNQNGDSYEMYDKKGKKGFMEKVSELFK